MIDDISETLRERIDHSASGWRRISSRLCQRRLRGSVVCDFLLLLLVNRSLLPDQKTLQIAELLAERAEDLVARLDRRCRACG
ncbi:MAG: hypothetical protein ACREFN_15315, partial [Acetobacteraceae bacterium]